MTNDMHKVIYPLMSKKKKNNVIEESYAPVHECMWNSGTQICVFLNVFPRY